MESQGDSKTCQGHAAHKAVVTQEADQSKLNLQDPHRGLTRTPDSAVPGSTFSHCSRVGARCDLDKYLSKVHMFRLDLQGGSVAVKRQGLSRRSLCH